MTPTRANKPPLWPFRILVALAVAMPAYSLWGLLSPVFAQSHPIRVIDADTFDAGLENNVRLPDWDGPEKGKRAKCQKERDLHVLAKAYAVEAIEKAERVELTLTGEECGWNRPCGDLILDGVLYSEIMAAAGYLQRWPHKNGKPLSEKPDWCEGK